MKKILEKSILVCIVLMSIFFLSGCMRYLTQDRNEVLLQGVDIDQTLDVAKVKMDEKQGRLGASLPIWVIRDQHINYNQAKEISELYFQYIDNMEKKFDQWHLTWAISNIYRNASDSIKDVIFTAYKDACGRARELKGIADRMVNEDKIFMGDAHSGGRKFARKHIVVPGNKKYLQSSQDYKK